MSDDEKAVREFLAWFDSGMPLAGKIDELLDGNSADEVIMALALSTSQACETLNWTPKKFLELMEQISTFATAGREMDDRDKRASQD